MIEASIILNKYRKRRRRKLALDAVVKDILIRLSTVDELPIGHVAAGDKQRLSTRHLPDPIPATQKANLYRYYKLCYSKARKSGTEDVHGYGTAMGESYEMRGSRNGLEEKLKIRAKKHDRH